MMKRFAVLCCAAVLGGCIPYKLTPAGPVEVDHKLTVQSPVAWSSLGLDRTVLMTREGEMLQRVEFHAGIEDGQTILKAVDHEEKNSPLMVLLGIEKDVVSYRFRKDMTEIELQDLFVATFSNAFGAPVTASNLRPFTLGGKPGFRFDFAFTGKDEVRNKGVAVGAVVADKLYLVHYSGDELYHFGLNLPDVEKMIDSLKFIDGGLKT